MNAQNRLQRAIEWLGSRYVLHPANRIQRLSKASQNDMHKADVSATFRRVYKQLNAGKP